MIRNVQYRLNTLIRVFAFVMALFFVVLAVYDRLEEEEKIEYFGEFVDETEFDYVDFPTSISRPTGNKSTKVQRMELIKVFDQIQTFLRLDSIIQPKVKLAESVIIYIPILIFEHIISTNAP
ncbi:hypothetical protein [Cecembia calidifontis]|uniref:Uncharacterized protein n=1 Tax=Cecembia calidifontis TaxID=1187080 RepID=A0A4Q7PAD7_9BACT|nr:hypothetical protein [Cecembia calidifontis]RZS96907.1 hypothetical protein BC751_2502 [Cecembia calidifontis]